MNRAELRRNSKQKLTYTLEEIEDIKQQTIDKECKMMFMMTFALPLMVMEEKHGWKQKRLTDFMDNILSKFEAVQRGEITREDIASYVKDRVGAEFGEESERRKV